MSDKTFKDVYEFLGIELQERGSQLAGKCPWCDGSKFFVDANEGLYDCKNCGEKGNYFTFVRGYSKLLFSNDDMIELKQLRKGIGTAHLTFSNIARLSNDEWLIPVHTIKNDKPSVIALRKWSSKTKVAYTSPRPSPGTGIYVARWNPKSSDVYVTEGEWDALALYRLFDEGGIEGTIISIPGVNTWPEKHLQWLKNKKVHLCFDHDEERERPKTKVLYRPGLEGALSAAKKAAKLGVSSVRILGWRDVEAPMDVRDYAISLWKKPRTAARNLLAMMVNPSSFSQEKGVEGEQEDHGPEPPRDDVTTFTEVIESFRRVYETTETFEHCVEIALACAVSNRISGEPLWVFLVGPPSSGKTTIIEAFADAAYYTYHLSKLTSTAFVSGRATGDSDPSILGNLKDKTLFVKDFTAVLSLPTTTQEELFGILRDAYDGSVRVKYGNGIERIYEDLRFTIFAGCTDEIHTKNHSSLGERFLKVEIVDPAFSSAAQTRAALTGADKDKTPLIEELKRVVYGYLHHLYTHDFEIPDLDDEEIDWLVALSEVVAYLRTVVRRKEGDIMYRPRAEVSTRVAKQLKKLYDALRIVNPALTKEDRQHIVSKVATDSCIGFALEFVSPIIKIEHGITTSEIAEWCQISKAHVVKVLRDLQEIGVVENRLGANNSGRAGTNTNLWFAAPRFLELWNASGMELKLRRRVRSGHRRAKRRRSVRRIG